MVSYIAETYFRSMSRSFFFFLSVALFSYVSFVVIRERLSVSLMWIFTRMYISAAEARLYIQICLMGSIVHVVFADYVN
jgi:hypothetical protein